MSDIAMSPSNLDKPSEKAESSTAAGTLILRAAEVGQFTLRALRARAEVQAIREVLTVTGWNRKEAARLLKVSYRGLLYKIRQYNITRP